ncbi:MAG TPA: TMEM175 family protein [Fimbriimonas sp.]|nr:TMEM175 family protein [Fimbriimonas sp.]
MLKQVEQNETARIEAFSDGVFAIAITLLVLEIKQPEAREGLLPGLLHEWPAYWGFVVSFLTILIMWINHHRMFRMIHKGDDWLLFCNGLLLMAVTFVPFPTGVLAAHLTDKDPRAAALFYSGTFVVIAIFYNVLWWCVSHQRRLIGREISQHQVAALTKQYMVGPVAYLLATLLAFVHVNLCIATNMLMALFFAIPSDAFKRSRAA